MAGWGGLSLLSPLFLWQKRIREKEKKERVRERICACEQFSRTHKNVLNPGKIEAARLKDINSNAFEFNSNDLNRK